MLKISAPTALFAAFISLTLIGAATVWAAPTNAYRKHDIAVARFGEGDRQEMLKKAYSLKGNIDQKIAGQERVTKALQDRLVQYVEGFGTRDRDPVALHVIGLPGIGKSVMLDELEKLGFSVVRFDAQIYADNSSFNKPNFANDLRHRLTEALSSGKPVIVLVDELDKIPELTKDGEVTRPFIGTLNQVLTDGRLIEAYGTFSLSNIMVISTMNFSPEEIEAFSEDALKKKKGYYDYTIDDFAAFDTWLTNDPSARYKVLSHLFRSNTVSRLAPNTLVMKPLNREDYLKIVRLNIDKAVARSVNGTNASKRVEVTYSDAFVEFIFSKTVFAPSGARETVFKTDALTEQLINFATKAAENEQQRSSLDRPRRIKLDADAATGNAVVTVVPLVIHGKELLERDSFQFIVPFDPNSRLFMQPQTVSVTPPESLTSAPKDVGPPKITKKSILEARFPKNQKAAKGLADKIDEKLLGQEMFTKLVEREFNSYLGRKEPVVKQPPFLVFAGFPGIGKSELVVQTGAKLGLPIVRMNMQAFSSDSADALTNFVQTLQASINEIRNKTKDGKFILLFEELDKVFEIAPNGAFVNRPVMAILKDLLNDGVAQVPASNGNGVTSLIDIRSAFTMVTMNFTVDRFGFEADPRLTSIEDVLSAWGRLNGRLADLKAVLGSMFLPETVSRLISRTFVMKPLEEKDYKRIIIDQAENVIHERLTDKQGVNRGQIDLKLSPSYRRYLYGETVIPSEGARYTAVASRNRIANDLEKALTSIPKSNKLAGIPIVITLDFSEETSIVRAIAKAQDEAAAVEPLVLFKKPIVMTYPPLADNGKLSEERITTAVREFGHAFTSIRLGRRILFATVVPPKAGVGGYVKYKHHSNSAKSLLASVYSALGSRAMERIFMSADPKSQKSVLDITSGPPSDILQATKILWSMLFEFGMDPNGGTIERMGVEAPSRYAAFSDLSPEDVEKVGKVLREMENFLVDDLLKAHDRDWYREKIMAFAHAGGVTEHQMFDLIGYPWAGNNTAFLGEETAVRKEFADEILPESEEVRAAAEHRQGNTKTTARENMDQFTERFAAILAKKLHLNASALKERIQTTSCENVLLGK